MATVDRMINLLPYYMHEGENTRKYYKALSKLYDELLNVFVDIIDSRDIDKSKLYGLDIIGDIVGELREGRTDDLYRSALKTKIIANRSGGDIETLNNYMRGLMGQFYSGIIEGENTNLTLRYTFPSVDNPVAYLKKATAAGISIDTQIQTHLPVVGQRLGILSFNKKLTTI